MLDAKRGPRDEARMRKTSPFGWVALAMLLGTTTLGACAKSPEGFCEDWAADTCEAITSCCTSGAKFDPDACRLDLSKSCQSLVDVEAIHAGEAEFHSGAASDCFGSIETCKDIETSVAEFTFERQIACLSIVSGFRPVGAACSETAECEFAGEYPHCYDGISGGGGVCVEVEIDDASCSFSFDDNVLHVCGEGKYCDLGSWEPPASAPPTSRAFEFKASCKSFAGNGAACIDQKDHLIPCAAGLYCDFTSGQDAKCAKQKSAGAECSSSSECAAGLDCDPNPDGPGQICVKDGGPYCFTPAQCGNGACEPTEDEVSCPADCGVSPGGCGDGYCAEGEASFCTEDCCGDGFCDSGEAGVCSSDCGI